MTNFNPTIMYQFFSKTEKDYISQLERYAFDGRIEVIQSEREALRAVEYLRKCKLLGIDTETKPSFKRGIQYQVALLQVASEDDICFLFRLNFMGFPSCLISILEDPSIHKVGLSLHDDFRALAHRTQEFHPAGFTDIQHLASGMGIQDLSLQKLYANVFGRRISKNAQLSNWEAEVLDEKQRIYAATDAAACIRLYKIMSKLHASGEYRLTHCPTKEEYTNNDNAL